ncbi:MAG TPA: hypothetical protein VFX93_15900, partial [Xanthomonadaceae bacterium]|nr:hypothetical protein [Xanthomonadaceae bacterium]
MPNSPIPTTERGPRIALCAGESSGDQLGAGLIDALRARFPDERVYTFWDYFRNHWPRDAGLRIDHLLLNRALAPAL